MKILYVTAAENGLYGLRHLMSSGVAVHSVVTISGAVAERANVSGFADVAVFCRTRSVPVITLDSYNLTPADLPAEDYDLLVVNGWNRLIGPDVLARFRLGGLGIHAGHPPIGFGRAPLPWNIIKGFRDIEVYVFRLTPRADDGDIVASRTVEITPFDDVQTLYEKVMFWGARLFGVAIKGLVSGSSAGAKQNLAAAIHYPKRTPEDGLIDFSSSLEDLHDFIRAQSRPYPGAYTFMDGEKCEVWRASAFDAFSFREMDRVPGRIVAALPSGLVVQTGSAPIWLREVTCRGRPVVPQPLDALEALVGKCFGFQPPARSGDGAQGSSGTE